MSCLAKIRVRWHLESHFGIKRDERSECGYGWSIMSSANQANSSREDHHLPASDWTKPRRLGSLAAIGFVWDGGVSRLPSRNPEGVAYSRHGKRARCPREHCSRHHVLAEIVALINRALQLRVKCCDKFDHKDSFHGRKQGQLRLGERSLTPKLSDDIAPCVGVGDQLVAVEGSIPCSFGLPTSPGCNPLQSSTFRTASNSSDACPRPAILVS